MAQRQLNLVYALRHGEIVSIADVESGLKCECTCPACGELLVAKKRAKDDASFCASLRKYM